METHIANKRATRVLKDATQPYCAKIARVIAGYERRGLSKAKAKELLAEYLERIVQNEYYDAYVGMSLLISELSSTAVSDLDYRAIAEDLLSGYSPLSDIAGRSPPESAAKPRSSANKRPAHRKTATRKTAPKKAGTARGR